MFSRMVDMMTASERKNRTVRPCFIAQGRTDPPASDSVDAGFSRLRIAGTPEDLAADGNKDGAVDPVDLQMWLENFEAADVSQPVTGVPEPATLALTAACGLAFVQRQRNRTSKNRRRTA